MSAINTDTPPLTLRIVDSNGNLIFNRELPVSSAERKEILRAADRCSGCYYTNHLAKGQPR